VCSEDTPAVGCKNAAVVCIEKRRVERHKRPLRLEKIAVAFIFVASKLALPQRHDPTHNMSRCSWTMFMYHSHRHRVVSLPSRERKILQAQAQPRPATSHPTEVPSIRNGSKSELLSKAEACRQQVL